MKQLFDVVSFESSKLVTQHYSTSFSLAVKLLSPTIQNAIYSIYGFVRFADEIVDTFHNYNKEELILKFEQDYYDAIEKGISLNPILNSFQHTIKKYNITNDLIDAFLKSMKSDLHKQIYTTKKEFNEYIHGSADVVGLMCLKVFVNGNTIQYQKLKKPAMRLGSAFQKVNFLRDIKDDYHILDRSYFPNVDFTNFNQQTKETIILDIESDFEYAYKKGILELPKEARLGVYTAYMYYKKLLAKIKNVPVSKVLETRIRISNLTKIYIIARSFVRYKLNLL